MNMDFLSRLGISKELDYNIIVFLYFKAYDVTMWYIPQSSKSAQLTRERF